MKPFAFFKRLVAFSASTSPLVALILLCASTAAVFAQAPLAWGDLTPGPYAVGFKTATKYDYSRSYETKSSNWGLSPRGERAREMQLWVWYPATPVETSRFMAITDYVAIEVSDIVSKPPEGPSSTASILSGPLFADFPKQRVYDLLKMKTAAIRDAPPRDGRFPLIVFGQGYYFESPIAHSVLCEYLASHGFVVATVPYRGYPLRSSFHDLVGVEQEVRDMEFVIASMHDFPSVDHDRMAVAGFDYGGLAALLLQMRNTDVDALIGIDTGIIFRHNNVLLKQSPYYNLANLRVPMLLITKSHAENGDDEDLSVYEQARYSEAYLLRLGGMEHQDFTFYGLTSAALRAGDPAESPKRIGYAVACRYVLNFLEAYVKGDRQALVFLTNKPEANDARQIPVTIVRKAARKAPPNEREFIEILLTKGVPRAREVYREVKSTDPTYVLFKENTLITLGYQHLQAEKFKQAIELFKLNVEAYPESWNAYDSLAEAFMDDGQKELAIQTYRKSLELNPQNTNAVEMLKKLGAK